MSFRLVPRARVVVPFSPGPAWVRADTGWIGSVVLASHKQQTNNTSESAQPTASVGEMHRLFKLLAKTLRHVNDLDTRLHSSTVNTTSVLAEIMLVTMPKATLAVDVSTEN